MKQKAFSTAGELIRYVKEHVDSVEEAMVFVSGMPQITSAETGQKRLAANVGMLLVLCDGRKMEIPRPRAVELPNDGILSRLNIRTTFH